MQISHVAKWIPLLFFPFFPVPPGQLGHFRCTERGHAEVRGGSKRDGRPGITDTAAQRTLSAS